MTPSRRIQPAVENTDMYMWSSVNTWLRSTHEAVEVLGPLVVLDRRHRRLQARDVRLEEDRHAVAEAPLRPVADDLEEPGRGRREHRGRRRRS